MKNSNNCAYVPPTKRKTFFLLFIYMYKKDMDLWSSLSTNSEAWTSGPGISSIRRRSPGTGAVPADCGPFPYNRRHRPGRLRCHRRPPLPLRPRTPRRPGSRGSRCSLPPGRSPSCSWPSNRGYSWSAGNRTPPHLRLPWNASSRKRGNGWTK